MSYSLSAVMNKLKIKILPLYTPHNYPRMGKTNVGTQIGWEKRTRDGESKLYKRAVCFIKFPSPSCAPDVQSAHSLTLLLCLFYHRVSHIHTSTADGKISAWIETLRVVLRAMQSCC